MIAKKLKTGKTGDGRRVQRLHDDIKPVDMITESLQAQEGPDKVVDRPAMARTNNLLFFKSMHPHEHRQSTDNNCPDTRSSIPECLLNLLSNVD